jgi:hypothetical protein
VLQQSSDKHLFVSDFWLCDPRMEVTGGTGRVGYNWVISHEGDWLWPQRVEQQPDDDDLNQNGKFSNPAAILHESVAFDCIKDSSLPLSPELHRHATRTGTWYTQNSEALSTWDLGADAAYVGDRLELDGNQTDSAAVELSRDDLEVSGLMQYRIMVTAAPSEKGWLLVRWEGFQGTGEHAHAWIDLTNKQISSTSDLNIDAMSVEDIGGGVARYLLTVSNADGDFDAGQRLVLRVVDDDAENDVTGDDGDGVRLISCIIQRQCIA